MSTAMIECRDVAPAAGDPEVTLRLLQRHDTGTVRAVFAGLGPRSRWLRFLSGKPRLTGADLRRLTAVDPWTHVAVVASTVPEGRPIGIARFVRDPEEPGSAEVAVAVVDAWQRRGVGTRLVGDLVERAVGVGVRRFTLTVSAENAAVLALIDRFPSRPTRVDLGLGISEYAVTLDGVRP